MYKCDEVFETETSVSISLSFFAKRFCIKKCNKQCWQIDFRIFISTNISYANTLFSSCNDLEMIRLSSLSYEHDFIKKLLWKRLQYRRNKEYCMVLRRNEREQKRNWYNFLLILHNCKNEHDGIVLKKL